MKYGVILSLTVLLTACTGNKVAEAPPERIGQPEPRAVSFLDGQSADLDQLIAGKPAIINFWAASCVFCRHELPWFQAVHEEVSAVSVVGVNMQEPPRIANEYWAEGGYTFPSLLDPQNDLRRRYRVSIQPTTIFVDAQGQIVSRKDGPLREDELVERVEQLLNVERADAGIDPDLNPNPNPSPSPIPVSTSPVPSSLASWYSGDVKHLIAFEDILSGGPAKDGIPAIDEPQFLSVAEADYLDDDDLGILVSLNGDTRFYSYRVLNWHEIVNDTVGGQPIFVTYCPLCATGVTYSRVMSEGTTTFGVSGLLSQSNLLMYDRATETLWNQVTGQAVVGPLTGETLEYVRSDVVTFQTVKQSFPTAQVLSTATGHFRDYSRDPYAGYENESTVMFPVRAQDDRLHSKELVFGIVIAGQAKAYRQSDIHARGTITDQLAGTAVLVAYDADTEQITFTNRITGAMIPTLPVFWFSWVAQYPDTALYE